MNHMGEGTRPSPFSVTGNGHELVTEPGGKQFSGRNLGMIILDRPVFMWETQHAMLMSETYNWQKEMTQI